MVKKIIGFLCSVLFCTVIAVGMPQMAGAAETETFTGASGISGDLNWNITADGHLTIEGTGDYERDFCIRDFWNLPGWCEYRDYIKTAEVNVQDITFTNNMFFECRNLTSLDVSHFNTDKVINMAFMFDECSSLTNLDVSNFNTDKVIDMDCMFNRCYSLTSLDVSHFNTDKVTDMSYMFYGCSGLTSLDISNFKTNKVTDMSYMFSGCSSLTSLNLSNFNTNMIKDGFSFYLNDLYSLEKLSFFANSSMEYDLPSSDGYYWVNDNQETVTKTAKDVDRKVDYFKIKDPSTPIPDNDINTGIYSDASCASLASISARTLFAYGGNVKQTNGSKINYKSKTYYTNLQVSNIVTTNNKGKTKTKKGKLVIGVTSTNTKPTLVKGKIPKDVAASKIAKASISKGKVKVTAQKESGVVYVWVMDTGDSGGYVCAKFVINAAPSKLQVFARASSDAAFSADKRTFIKKIQ